MMSSESSRVTPSDQPGAGSSVQTLWVESVQQPPSEKLIRLVRLESSALIQTKAH